MGRQQSQNTDRINSRRVGHSCLVALLLYIPVLIASMPPVTPSNRNEIVDWYHSIPPITRAIFTLSIATTVAPALGLVNPYWLILNWNAVAKLQVFRFVLMCVKPPLLTS